MTLLFEIEEKFKTMLKSLFRNRGFQYFYNRGIDKYNKKEYEKAVELFKLAIEQPNVQPQVYYNLGLTYQCIKNYDYAIVYYNKFLEKRPNDYDAMYNLALTYFSLENFEKSIEIYEKCLDIKKEEDLVKALTLAYINSGNMEKAAAMAEEIIKVPNKGIKLYMTIAKVFESKNSFSKDFTLINKAIEMYSRIIEIDSSNFEAYIAISICFAKEGEWEKSVDYCKKALLVNPTSFDANNQMGLIYYCCNETEEAIKYYENALKLRPRGDYKIYSNLAYAYEKQGDTKKAIKIFTQLLNKFPNIPAKMEIKNHLRILKTKHI